ncbi:MAG: hypothetical protein QM681_23260 [Novosphingobium sp.]
MPGEFLPALGLGQIAPHAGGEHYFFDEARDLLAVQPIRPDLFAFSAEWDLSRDAGTASARSNLQRSTISRPRAGASEYDLMSVDLNLNRRTRLALHEVIL